MAHSLPLFAVFRRFKTIEGYYHYMSCSGCGGQSVRQPTQKSHFEFPLRNIFLKFFQHFGNFFGFFNVLLDIPDSFACYIINLSQLDSLHKFFFKLSQSNKLFKFLLTLSKQESLKFRQLINGLLDFFLDFFLDISVRNKFILKCDHNAFFCRLDAFGMLRVALALIFGAQEWEVFALIIFAQE